MSEAGDEAVMRLAGRLVLDQVTQARFGFDLVDALVMVTVTQANVEPISRDPELQRRYATYEQVPPDDLRRPISVNAIAQSLGIPFETVRRRIVKMSLLGLFRTTRLGVTTASAMVHNPRHRKALEACYARARALHQDLDRCGLGEAYDTTDAWDGDPTLRLIARATADYLLRLVHLLMDETGDTLSAAVWLAIFCDNVAVEERGPARAIPGAQRPMTMAALARRLRLSTETVRRRIQALVADGLCVQEGSTVVVDASVLARPGVQRLLTRNRQDVRRMFATLAEHGVPQAWRQAAPLSSVAA